jgi:uncharacterized membrane protein (GlpM family)
MADLPSLALLAGIPCVLIIALIASTKNTKLTVMAALFATLLLFTVGYSLDTGNARSIFSTMIIINLLAIPAYFIILVVMTLGEFITVFKKRA